MKPLVIIVIAACLLSCVQSKKNEQKSNEKTTVVANITENFDWLLGKWKRANEAKGKETFEQWRKISNTNYSGFGFTMQNNDTIWQEKLQLLKSNKTWDLTVKSPDKSESTVFVGTHHNENEFTCKNSKNEFPNTIKYWKNGSKINALVSNEEIEISFNFEKTE